MSTIPNTAELFKSSETKMQHAVEAMEASFNTLRTGRASTALLDKVTVDAYGTPSPLQQIASVSTPDARSIVITPWDKGQLSSIEKALLIADLGLTPQNDGKQIRLIVPPLTEERRKELVKKAHGMAEDGRIAIRNVRKHGKEQIEKMKKNKELTEDLAHDATDQLQKVTDKYIAKIDDVLKKKEKEIMEI